MRYPLLRQGIWMLGLSRQTEAPSRPSAQVGRFLDLVRPLQPGNCLIYFQKKKTIG